MTPKTTDYLLWPTKDESKELICSLTLQNLARKFKLSWFLGNNKFCSWYNVANNQVTRHLSLISDNYALCYLACFSKFLVLKPSLVSKKTKIGLRWSKTSPIRFQSQFKISLKMLDHRIKTTHNVKMSQSQFSCYILWRCQQQKWRVTLTWFSIFQPWP